MLRLYRIDHSGTPLYAAEREGRWRIVDGDIFGSFTEGPEVAHEGLRLMAPRLPLKNGRKKPITATTANDSRSARVKNESFNRPGAKNTKTSGRNPMATDRRRVILSSRSGVGLQIGT